MRPFCLMDAGGNLIQPSTKKIHLFRQKTPKISSDLQGRLNKLCTSNENVPTKFKALAELYYDAAKRNRNGNASLEITGDKATIKLLTGEQSGLSIELICQPTNIHATLFLNKKDVYAEFVGHKTDTTSRRYVYDLLNFYPEMKKNELLTIQEGHGQI